MTTKELIREKIDAFYAEYKAKFHQNGDSYHLGIIDGLDMAERLLDTLPDEPITSCNELAEAAMNYIAPIENEDGLKVINFSGRDIKDAFIAGAEWGANHLRDTTKMMGDELEEIAENIYKVPFGTRAEDFKAGAEWQKKQFEKKES